MYFSLGCGDRCRGANWLCRSDWSRATADRRGPCLGLWLISWYNHFQSGLRQCRVLDPDAPRAQPPPPPPTALSLLGAQRRGQFRVPALCGWASIALAQRLSLEPTLPAASYGMCAQAAGWTWQRSPRARRRDWSAERSRASCSRFNLCDSSRI